MSDETWFTRETWRPSHRRASYPRVRDYGGRTQITPAMAAHVQAGVFAPGAPRCAHCKRPAMRDLPVCRQHGGARWAAARRPYVTTQDKLGRRFHGTRNAPKNDAHDDAQDDA